MNKRLLLTAVVLMMGIFTAQAQMGEWKEMDAFHGVMAMTFHPAEDGDMKPVLTRSGELAEKALLWKKSAPPAKFNKPEIKKNLALLTKESKALDKMVKKGKPEAEIKAAIFALHDRFHLIMEKCDH